MQPLPFRPAASLLLVLVTTLAAASPAASPPMAQNPLLAESPLAYQYPPFDQIRDEHFMPAFEQGMADELREVDAIARDPAPPTFENTIVALERSGLLLNRVDRIFSNLNDANTNPAMMQVESAMAPRLAAQKDAIHLNRPLFARIASLFDRRQQLGLDAESLRLLEKYHKDFVRAGARLSDADQARLRTVNEALATLEAAFGQNVLKESNASAVAVLNRSDLDGLTPAEIAAAEAAARADKRPEGFLIQLANTTDQPVLASLRSRALRERIEATSAGRCSRGGPFDNRDTVIRMARLRAERAALLGYATHAAYELEDQTAGDPGTVDRFLADLARPAAENARREAADIQAVIDAEHAGFQLAPWDWDFYAEKVRLARHAFDEAQVRPYFEIGRVLQDGVFYAAHQLYGITFKERHDLPVYDPGVRVFEVFDANGTPLALFLADLYARPSKRGGAWMTSYVDQSRLLGTRPVVGIHLNVPKPPPGQPALLTFDEVQTMFHETGHALHGMFSSVRYPYFSGTDVARDFVEFPSQVNEVWALWPEVLTHYARHERTGEPMPPALVDKLQAAQRFNQGYATAEYLAAAVIDMAWHELTPGKVPADVAAFEAGVLRRAGLDLPAVPPRYHSTYFLHIFGDAEYSAGYYAYIWAEVLDADTVAWFRANGGLTRANGDRLRAMVLSRGDSEEPMALFRAFIGHGPEVQPLLERRGLDRPAPR